MTGKLSPEDQRAFNVQLVATLEQLGIPYAVGGSVAAMSYSEHRFTVDIDVMIDASIENLAQLVNEVDSWHIYISPLEAILEVEIPNHMPFNVIDGLRGTRADFYVARPTGLDASAMTRRRRMLLYSNPEAHAWFLSPEDVILYKLDYFRQSGETSAKHPADIAKMLRVIGDELDLAYLAEWSAQIGVADLWAAMWDEHRKASGNPLRARGVKR
ncbi:MAG: hypothetical protein M1140_03150 [Chloroflexi bacterium]|nr:hypothetical protein [Chloroflexota bacterium]